LDTQLFTFIRNHRSTSPESALERGQRLDQRAIDTEVLLGQQAAPVGLAEEPVRHLTIQQPIPMLGEGRMPDGTNRFKTRAHAAGREHDRTDGLDLSVSPRQRLSHLSMRKCLQHAGMLVPKCACRDNNGWHIQWPKDKPQVIYAPTQADLVPLLASRLKDLGRVDNVGPHVAPENACPTCR